MLPIGTLVRMAASQNFYFKYIFQAHNEMVIRKLSKIHLKNKRKYIDKLLREIFTILI